MPSSRIEGTFRRAVGSLVGFVLCAYCMSATPVAAQLLDDKANLKILNTRSKLLLLNKHYFDELLKQQGAPTSEDDTRQYIGRVGCGSVEIGNQSVNSTISSEISVVIVGDVINFGNRCGR